MSASTFPPSAPTWSDPKPRMAFFRYNDTNLPEFINGHFRDHVRCLEQFFDVVVISTNADYDEVVDRVQPDISMFESGVYARAGRAITNTHRHSDIPKVGFLDADAYCLTRSVFLADMDDWGVDTFFAIGVSAAGYTPDIADRTYAWPNFADRSIFRTYPDGPSQSILLSGSRENNYPWRVKVDRLLRDRFPVRALPHAGWFDRDKSAAMPSGEEYARSLGSALIIPTCGTIAEDLVRKHFEIPASGALLLTERTAAVEAAGFSDMENCVFADASDVVDKVEFLLDNVDVVHRISRAGQELAHAHHSIENRDQIRQWFELNRTAAAGRIVQPEIFGSLLVEEADGGGRPVCFITPPGVDRKLIAAGLRHLTAGEPGPAAERFAEVLNYHFEPEAAFGLARSWIRLGRPDWARPMLEYSTGVVLKPHGASHPDPVEWAWLVRVALCESDLPRARALALQYPRLRHRELDRIRTVVGNLTVDDLVLSDRGAHRSVHAGVGDDPWGEWSADLISDLNACGQHEIAHRMTAVTDPALRAPARSSSPGSNPGSMPGSLRASWTARRFLARARGRAVREWSKVRGRDPYPERVSAFQLLGGRQLDSIVLLLVPSGMADKVESLVDHDPSALTLVRIGRGSPPVGRNSFAPRGLRSGIDPAILRQLPHWGRSAVITTRLGASMVGAENLAKTDLVVIIGDGAATTAVEHDLRTSSDWRQAPDDLADRIAKVLGDTATVWERSGTTAPGHPRPQVSNSADGASHQVGGQS